MSSNHKETLKKSSGRFISFIKHAFSLVQSSHLALYSSKYSRRDYIQHQLLTILLFKEYRKEDYRTVMWDLVEMDRVRETLGLTTIPHFTTLQKLLNRIKPVYLDILFKSTLKLFYFPDDTISITALDSAGFTSGYYSHYYSERIGKIRKHFMKTSISVDIDQQVITGFIISKSRIHDSKHAYPLLKKCHKNLKSECYVMDRGYDSEKMHRFIRESLKAISIIPTRSWRGTEHIWGKYRREMTDNFDAVRYRKRFLVETKFSVLKRRFGADLKSRIYQIQKKEIACKIVLANLDRFIQLFCFEVFYRAHFLIHSGIQYVVNRMAGSGTFFLDKAVLVTGASGFIGRHLLDQLAGQSAHITTISRNQGEFPTDIEQYALDIGDEQALRDCITTCRPEYIIHLAAFKERSPAVESLYTALETNLIGTLNIFSAAKDTKSVKSIITLGTAEEYGNNLLPFHETARESPASPYSFSKLCVTHLGELFWRLYDLPVVVIRPTLAYGPGQGTDMFLPALITALRDNEPFSMTPGDQTRDFIYVGDLVEALLLAAQTPRSRGQVINIGSGKPVKLSELAGMVGQMMGKSGLVRLGGKPYRKTEVMDYYVDLKKAEDLLYWHARTSLHDGIEKTIAYYCGVQEE